MYRGLLDYTTGSDDAWLIGGWNRAGPKNSVSPSGQPGLQDEIRAAGSVQDGVGENEPEGKIGRKTMSIFKNMIQATAGVALMATLRQLRRLPKPRRLSAYSR